MGPGWVDFILIVHRGKNFQLPDWALIDVICTAVTHHGISNAVLFGSISYQLKV